MVMRSNHKSRQFRFIFFFLNLFIRSFTIRNYYYFFTSSNNNLFVFAHWNDLLFLQLISGRSEKIYIHILFKFHYTVLILYTKINGDFLNMINEIVFSRNIDLQHNLHVMYNKLIFREIKEKNEANNLHLKVYLTRYE